MSQDEKTPDFSERNFRAAVLVRLKETRFFQVELKNVSRR